MLSMILVSTLLAACICSTSGQPQGPTFTETAYEVSVNETFIEGGYLQPEQGFLTLSCNYSNSTALTYMLMAEDDIPFTVDLTTGEMAVTQDLDYESVTQYNFVVICTIEDDLNMNDTANVTVHLLPVNEYRPVIRTLSMFTPITESTSPGLLTSTLPGVAYNVSDMDQPPDEIYYTLIEGNYEDLNLVYNETLNGIVLTQQYDRENLTTPTGCSVSQLQFRVTVCDIDPPNENCPNIVLTVSLLPSNDNNPTFSEDLYSVTVPESTPPNTTLISVVCTDDDICLGSFGGMEITDVELANMFSINNNDIVNLVDLDYEDNASYNITVRCYDMAIPPKEAFTTVEINLTDVNDNAPRCLDSVAGDLKSGTHQLTTVLRLSCVDEDEGVNSQLTFRVDGELPHIPTGQFSLDPTIGELTFTGDIDDSTSEFNISILVSDSGSTPLISRVQVRVSVTSETTLPTFVTSETTLPTLVTSETILPMFLIIVVCIVGGFLLIGCLILFCCCCFCCIRQRKKKMKKTTLCNLAPVVEENVYVQTQGFTGAEGEINLFLDDNSPNASLRSYNIATGNYVITNTTVAIGEELVEATGQELETRVPVNLFSEAKQEELQEPKSTSTSQPLATTQDTVLNLDNTM